MQRRNRGRAHPEASVGGRGAAARYNVGMASFINGHHENALRRLREARTVDPENFQVAHAIEEVLRARELESEVGRVHGGGNAGDEDDEGHTGVDPPIASR